MPTKSAMLFVMLLLSGVLAPNGNAQGYLEVDPFDASIAAIGSGFRDRPDGSNHAIILGLRQLEDPGMQPIFQRLLDSESSALRVDGLLALAEIGPGHIDPFLLKTFTPEERMLATLAAIDLDLLDEDTIETMLELPDLLPVEYINLAACGHSLGAQPPKARLKALTETQDATTRWIAAVLMAELGTPDSLERLLAGYPGLKIIERERLTAALSDLASRHPMPAALPLLRLMTADEELSRGTRLAAVEAALMTDSPEGVALWEQAAKVSPTSGDRMRLGVMGLDRDIRMDDWSSFRDGRRFNELIADLGEAVASDRNVESANEALVRARNPILMEGAISVAERSPEDVADGSWNAIIDFAIEQPKGHPLAIRVISHLADTGAACLPELLGRMQDATDSKVGEVAMIGLLNSSAPEAVAHASVFRNHPDRAVRSLALLVEARGGEKPSARELEELSGIAAGAGRLSPNMRAVAAWLWLRHTNQQERAVARIVGEA